MTNEIKEILDKCTPFLFGDEVDKLTNYITKEESLESELFLKMELLKKRIYKLEWIIAILVSVLFSIGYCVLLQLCIRWLF